MSLESNDISIFSSTNTISNHLANRQNELILRYFDIGIVASTLEDSIVVSNPVIFHRAGKSRDVEQAEYEEDRAFVHQNLAKNTKLCKKLDRQVEARRLLFSTIREVYPDFCQGADKKIPPEDYALFMQQQKKLRQLLTHRYHASTSEKDEKRVADYVLERKDQISELTDSENFSKACLIEDKFMISELKKYLDLERFAPQEAQRLQHKCVIPYRETKSSAENLARIFIEERQDRSKKLKQILELFDKMQSKKFIEFPNDDEEPFSK